MPLTSIVMPYKENCKTEGEIMTGFKIARMYFADGEKQKDIASYLRCHPNTVNGIIGKCRLSASPEAWPYLKTSRHISRDQLQRLFSFFEHDPRRPHSHKDSLRGDAKRFICEKFEKLNYGHKRLFRHLRRKGYDVKDTFTLGKIKGVYKRQGFKVKKIRTANRERRALYNYDQIEAFEYLQYDTKEIADKHSLPAVIYEKFKNSQVLPKFQWTIVDAKSKIRFLAWSYALCSLFGLKFLEFTICWLRAHGVRTRIHTQIDGGSEFCSASERKLTGWNDYLSKYNAHVYDTGGAKWKQNLVERTHRTDDEEFYCPRGDLINSKTEFIIEGQFWIIYYNNHRSNDGIGLNGMSPKDKLEQLGFYNAEDICNFPCLILEDLFQPFQTFFNIETTQKFLNQKVNKSHQ